MNAEQSGMAHSVVHRAHKNAGNENPLHDALLSLILLLPVLVLVIASFLPGLSTNAAFPFPPLQYDQLFYPAAAREYADAASFSFLYANPADPSLYAPRIYFNLPVLVLGGLLALIPADPYLVFVLAGLAAAWLCLFTCVRFWRAFSGSKTSFTSPGIWIFCWGGGLFGLAGALYLLFDPAAFTGLFMLEPSRGWWALNWGRNLVLPLEALYHLLFILMVYRVFKGKYLQAAGFCALLVLSHPFTGLQAGLILLVWMLVERIVFVNRRIRLVHLLVPGLMLAALLCYYLWFLNSYPSHRQVYDQWKLPLRLLPWQALLAYGMLVPAVLAAFWKSGCREFRTDPFARFLLVWMTISLLLVFHDCFLPARQPLHFTRGYLWLSLFLLSYPVLKSWLPGRPAGRSMLRRCFTVILPVLLLSDNLCWFGLQIHEQEQQYLPGRHRQEVLQHLAQTTGTGDLILSDDAEISYFALLYTPARALFSHWANTPAILEKIAAFNEFRMRGNLSPEWKNQQPVLVLETRRNLSGLMQQRLREEYRLTFANKEYRVYSHEPEE
ncbi:MAG TPA: hypothetical protein P5531_12350 [Bacteroidales bacterium]|nr:hypothetical protein [Bacteroidales bacterium]HSA44369.1 hypothetical protein [Bacteroidales bacterium]